jgi:hypothetical protein
MPCGNTTGHTFVMSEGAEVERDILTFELGDLEETSASTKINGKQRRGLQKNSKKVGARVHTSLPLLWWCWWWRLVMSQSWLGLKARAWARLQQAQACKYSSPTLSPQSGLAWAWSGSSPGLSP